MSGVWSWEAYDRRGVRRISDTLGEVWWTDDPAEVAEIGMARLMGRAAPRYWRVRAWRVRAWRGHSVGWACADDWLRVLTPTTVSRLAQSRS